MLSWILATNLLVNKDPITFPAQGSWKSLTSQGVDLKIGGAGPDLRLDYDFNNRNGYVLAEHPLAVDLPENFVFEFDLRAESPANDFEFKLNDPSGDIVWWVKKIGYRWPTEWNRIRLQKRDFVFAWGPDSGPLKRISSFQFGVAAREGGRGRVEIRNLTFRPLPAPAPFSDQIRLTETRPGRTWSAELEGTQEIGAIRVHLDRPIENGKLTLLADGELVREIQNPDATLVLPTPGLTAKQLVAESTSGRVQEIKILPYGAASDPNRWLEILAKDSPTGAWPSHLTGEQIFFTVVGTDPSENEILFNEAGEVELGKGRPMLAPLLRVNGRWSPRNLESSKSELLNGYLPLPKTTHTHGPTTLTVEPLALEGSPDRFAVRYTVSNTSSEQADIDFAIALRPVQVNPAWQGLNMVGGFAPIEHLRCNGSGWILEHQDQVHLSPRPQRIGACSFLSGEAGVAWTQGRFGRTQEVSDPDSAASGIADHRFRLKPGEARVFVASWGGDPVSAEQFAQEHKKAVDAWTERLSSIQLDLPPVARKYAEVLKSNVAYVLINRDGPRIQPGSRSYERTWIRDGSMTASSLAAWGVLDPAIELLDFYAPFVREDGYVPCVVDRRGADPVPEHDSHGQFLYLLGETFRHNGDRKLLERHYPTAKRVADFIIQLTGETEVHRPKLGLESGFAGLAPASISHEGYSAKPMHSFWDDFFLLRGLREAVLIAGELGHAEDQARWQRKLDELRRDVRRSIEISMLYHGIDYIPGCVELGDFDATSTAVALSPCIESKSVPQDLLENTFERYWQFFTDRRDGRLPYRDYTPYEIRVVNAMLRLGEIDRAHALMEWFLRDSLPSGWNHWAEIVHFDRGRGLWIGDMPHTWVGSEWIKAIRQLFVYEDPETESLQVLRGIPSQWLLSGNGVGAKKLTTWFGELSVRARQEGNTVLIDLEGTASPKGGFQVFFPGRSIETNQSSVRVERLPASLRIELWPGTSQ